MYQQILSDNYYMYNILACIETESLLLYESMHQPKQYKHVALHRNFVLKMLSPELF